ncbi:MAG: TadE/TadG family type IV pilus assembly protein [Albidovulum sp.]
MSKLINMRAAQGRLAQFLKEENGTTLVELAIVLPIFLLLFFALIDFGRMGAEYVMANKAVQMATRIAVVRPAACPGVPTTNFRGSVPSGTVPPQFGTMCSAGATICAAPVILPCSGNVANPTVAEIWTAVSGLMPSTATPANMVFRYDYNQNLGFLGGPFTPIVSVEIQQLNFQFVTPISALAAMVGSNSGSLPGATIPFPSMSNSLPAEDLDLGDNG